ncbi:MAG: homoserine kinase [Actinomycetota bacterium]|nr:homoserine kinase [Actinomycetota bacterium]
MPSASVSVPATSANLGPGYDSFGLALGLHNRFSAQPAEEWAVEIVGEGSDVLATDGTNRVARAMARVFQENGEPGRCAHIFCVNRIPPGRGLGSSAAALVGGMLLADALSEVPLGKHRIFEMATEMEGHPDNAAAALFGGLTLSWDDDGPRCVMVEPRGGLAVVVVTGANSLPTEESRALLPQSVPHADAAFNAARAGLLVAGLVLGREDLLAPGLADRLHQQYRAMAIPDFDAVRTVLLDAGAAGVVLSGAGPALIGLVAGTDDDAAFLAAREVARRAEGGIAALAERGTPAALRIDRAGAVVSLA